MRILIGMQTALAGAALALFAASAGLAQPAAVTIPERDEGEGPFERLILRGAYMIDGTGAPTQGPVDIVIENDRIAEIDVVGFPRLEIDPDDRPPLNEGREIDVSGMLTAARLHRHPQCNLHSEQTGQGLRAGLHSETMAVPWRHQRPHRQRQPWHVLGSRCRRAARE